MVEVLDFLGWAKEVSITKMLRKMQTPLEEGGVMGVQGCFWHLISICTLGPYGEA
jgi:hypothetical protein